MGYSASGLGIGLNQYYSWELPDFCRCLKLEAGLYFLAFFHQDSDRSVERQFEHRHN